MSEQEFIKSYVLARASAIGGTPQGLDIKRIVGQARDAWDEIKRSEY